MVFNIEDTGPCRKKVSVKVPPELVSEEFDKTYKNLIKTVPIPGFRPGHAPRKLVEKRFGEQVTLEVKQTLLDQAFEQALKENDLAPIADPELSIDDITVEPEQQLNFDFTITVKPEFDLPDLKGIEVSVPSADPSKEEIEAALLDLRKRKSTLRPLDGESVETGDVVTLKVRGTSGEDELLHEDDLPYEVGSSWLSGLVADGLDDVLVGSEVGKTVEAKAFAPAHAEGHPLQGAELEIQATIIDHKRPELPELDAALAKAFDFDSKDELVTSVTNDVRNYKERERDKLIETRALEQIVEKCEFELPAELIEREAEDQARRAAYELQLQKASEEDIAKKISEVRKRSAEDAARELRAFFVLDKIVEAERILVTENEVREAVAMLAAYNQKTPEQMYTTLRDSGRLGSLRNQLRDKKAREKLRKKAKVTDEAPPAAKKTTSKKKTASKKPKE